MLSGLSLAVSREQDRVGRRWGNKGVVEWAWLDEGQKMALGNRAHRNEFCFLHRQTQDQLCTTKELIIMHNYFINAKYFRIGRDLRGFVVSAKDKPGEGLSVFQLGPDWVAMPGQSYHNSHQLLYLKEKCNFQGHENSCVVASAFSPGQHTWQGRVCGLWVPSSLGWLLPCHPLVVQA